ncbi:sugar ABC transporter permease [Mycoplasma phocimorsus]|uniref:Sugar ABC transporter permease n=1 Tax=Mycoplasma phocimorsus TaxID=3045839 RepID=A0AAJ1UVP7_9MOLU|nr:sugar ABC transporter permease [Mycoplasma phocimorsus]MDJ1645764.1 sugar ABC transporter permease [Mycoplasma phocimorsus]MDJ1647263.1 sugar ABC transporter permease [Mycoplasma phocimorsus]MDJ1647912.1 sugar ABC transporter permease [Mycoplasma phocimorsus]
MESKMTKNNKLSFLSRLIRKLNPLANSYAKAYQIKLKNKYQEYINNFLENQEHNKVISRNDLRAIKVFNAKNDTKNALSIYTQEILATNSNNEPIILMVKLLSLYSSYLPLSSNARYKTLKLNNIFEKLILAHVSTMSNEWQEDIKKLIETKKELMLQKQNVVDFEVDVQRNFYWNLTQKVVDIIQKHVEQIVEIPHNIYWLIAKSQILLNESLFYLKQKNQYSLAKIIDYEHVSFINANTYLELKETIINSPIINCNSYLTHLSETSKYIRLSDLPPITLFDIIKLVISYALLIMWSVIIITPLVQMIIKSFDSNSIQYLTAVPNNGLNNPWYFHYENLFIGTQFRYWLTNSIIIATSTMTLTVGFTLLLAYAFSRFRFPGRKKSIMAIMIIQMVPSVAALAAILVLWKIFVQVSPSSSNKQILSIIFLTIIYTGGGLTGNTFILKGYIDSIPVDLDEAAKIDGASTIKVFTTVIIPLAKPMIAIVALWSFIGPFGDIILPKLLFGSDSDALKQYTMAAGLFSLITGRTVLQHEFLAGAIITAVPLTILFILTQKFLVSGLTKGAVK